MRKFTSRFSDALQTHLGETFTVTDMGHGLIVANHSGGGTLVTPGLDVRDKRAAVDAADVAAWVDAAARRARRVLPHFTPEARRDTETMLADLPANR